MIFDELKELSSSYWNEALQPLNLDMEKNNKRSCNAIFSVKGV